LQLHDATLNAAIAADAQHHDAAIASMIANALSYDQVKVFFFRKG
jgi:hypothetical protein